MTTRKSLICVAAILMSATAALADISVWLDPATPTVDVGGTVFVDLMASFDEPVMAWGLDLTIGYPTYASWIDTKIGDDWDATTTLDGDGLAGLRFPSGVSGDVLLATLTFEGLSAGTTSLAVSSGPEEDEGILLQAGSLATNVQFTGACLTVVPEPAAFVLLAGLLVLRRR